MSGEFLSLYGKYKPVWDFSSNNGLLTCKNSQNSGCVANRGTAKIPVADSYSVFFITCERQKIGGNAWNCYCCHEIEKVLWAQISGSGV